jgi:methionine sulfoxide reductase heme-binding subunit
MASIRNYQPDLYPGDAIDARNEEEDSADDYRPRPRAAKSRVDEWMEVEFKFTGSRIKRKTPAIILLGAPAALPLFFMMPALLTLNANTFSTSVNDTLGTGAEMCLLLCLLVTPMATLTRQHWFVPLRRWYGIMVACGAIGNGLGAGFFTNFAGGFFGRVAGHLFELLGLIMVMLLIPLLITSNKWAQRKLGRYWKQLQQLNYAVWGLLLVHLIVLDGFVYERGSNGAGFAGDGFPILHQRVYQYIACSVFLLMLRLPPVKRWIAVRQMEGRNRLVYLTIMPIFALFVFAFVFIVNEELFKGIASFTEQPSSE